MHCKSSWNLGQYLRIRVTLLVVASAWLCACHKETTTKSSPQIEPPPPLRQLVTRPLFGQMPVDNRVLDPQFALVDGQGWMPYTMSQTLLLSRVFLPHTPLGQPALWVPGATNPSDLTLLGLAKSAAEPLDASVWFGRKLTDPDLEMAQVSASVLGMFGDGTESTIDLSLDDATEPVVLDDIAWRRFATHLAETPLGWVYLSLANNTTTADLYITSPILVTSHTGLSLPPRTEAHR